ncbi:preprotein translocase subunit SecG [Candidatus Woesebacteria bacterium CG22_combo_CG10-13_8_21_14_all_39_10]|uniref:Protein-export membrane protein SecG n=3 Tax=Candidatus Woeseibacteriota TaxID=1752722 RepID=A0A2M7X9H7_9BACT|nr:MAG: preprotein translocase subunit SecG [Candidatus Woesebacteria bacterium CG22_combo_CG10-13_8_21_14_all_39_10]PIZ47855.1 MAG: preprotein translocase subunit SecG [Candidatus Woesebacteria bacterium CG_4_10_14_0_2_um_filter_39_14]PJA42817.1 MAG: preprotein translocase subunit SecG [Candidatus Woesebacteria bacterium CG_4_9_14_3_um_filter_39_10]
MKNIVLAVQMITSIALVILILIQSRGSGLGRSFGSGSSFSRRGFEKLLYKLTFVTAGLFILISLISLVI